MKKFILSALIAVLCFGLAMVPATSKAQTSFVSQYNKTLDTTFTGFLTKDFTLVNQVTSAFNIIEISFTATKISGTVGGTVTVQTSMNGTDWYTAQGTTAYTLTDATQTTSFKIINWCSKYIRIHTVGTATMSAQLASQLVARKLAVLRT